LKNIFENKQAIKKPVKRQLTLCWFKITKGGTVLSSQAVKTLKNFELIPFVY